MLLIVGELPWNDEAVQTITDLHKVSGYEELLWEIN